MGKRFLCGVPVVALAVAALAPPAVAGAALPWLQIPGSTASNTQQPAAVRTPDGNLQVLFVRPNPATTSNADLMHTAITPAGAIATPDPVVTGWATIANPALVLAPGGVLRAFFGGIRSTSSTDPQDGLESATAPAGGSPWSLMPGNVSITNASYSGDPDNAALTPDGTPLITWAGTSGVWVHRGLDPSGPESEYEGGVGNCCGYWPDLAVDGSTGQATIAWFSNATGKTGVYAQGVNGANGAPVGSPQLMPGSATDFNGVPNADPNSRTTITGRPGHAGVYIAYPGGYPTHTKVLLWAVGAPNSTTLAQGIGAPQNVTISPTPDGRLWVLWSEHRSGGLVVVGMRSNPQLSRFGAETLVSAPAAATSSCYRLLGNSDATGALDVLASFGVGASVSTWHNKLLPALTVALHGHVSRSHPSKLNVVVTDAGAPVAHVTVKAAGGHATTNGQGKAGLTIATTAKRLTVTASGAGYAVAAVTVKTRR